MGKDAIYSLYDPDIETIELVIVIKKWIEDYNKQLEEQQKAANGSTD